MTFITHGFRVSVISDVRERVRELASHLHFMLRRSSLVECVSVLHGTCLQCAEKKIHQYVKPCEENPRYTFLTIKSSLCSHNMKQARPWMLANLKIICQFHADPVHQNSIEIFWAEIYWGRLFLGSNLVSFNRTLVVPYEISKINFHVKKISGQCVKRDLIKFENINISRTS
jgi:hypothetical protein